MAGGSYQTVSTVSLGESNSSVVTWNSSTALNTVASILSNDFTANTLIVTLQQTSTITGGVVTFQYSTDGANWQNVTGITPGTQTLVGPTYTLQASTYALFEFNVTGFSYFQIVLSTAITGTGSVTIGYSGDSFVGDTVSIAAPITVSGVVSVKPDGTVWALSGTSANVDVTNTVTVTGTVAVTQSTSPWVVNVTQWASTALGTPQTFGTAPTGVVIGTSSDLYVAGTRARSNQTTTAAGVLDHNLVGIAGTTVATAAAGVQKVGIVGSTGTALDGTTAGILDENIKNVGGTIAQLAAPGTLLVGIVGVTGHAVDSTITPSAAPTNAIATSGVYDITAPAPINGQAVAMQLDQAANHLTFPGVQFQTGAAWNSSTSSGTVQYPTGTSTQGQLIGVPALMVQLDQTTTITGGKVTFQGTYDNINWVTIPIAQIVNPNTFTQLTNPYTFVANTNQAFLILLQGYVSIRANLTTAITGTGSVTPYWATLSINPITTTVVTGTGGTGSINVSVVPSSNTYFSHGHVATSATTQVKIESTTYTEQSTGAQRSMSSSSASDTSAGTGARTVAITWYDASGNGPNVEIVTLNGTIAVATVSTTMCFIESIKVMTVGSTGSNVGTISLFVNNSGGGGTIGTISATLNTTFWAHHYVGNGKTFHLTGINIGSTSTTVGGGAEFRLFAQVVPVANQPNEQISDTLVLFGQSSTATRNYNSPVTYAGPARVTLYVTPYTTTGETYYGAFDFFEQ